MKLLKRVSDLTGHTIRFVREADGLEVIITESHNALVINKNNFEGGDIMDFSDLVSWSERYSTTDVFDLLKEYRVISPVVHEAATETIIVRKQRKQEEALLKEGVNRSLLQEQAARVKDRKRQEYQRKGMLGKEPWRYE